MWKCAKLGLAVDVLREHTGRASASLPLLLNVGFKVQEKHAGDRRFSPALRVAGRRSGVVRGANLIALMLRAALNS